MECVVNMCPYLHTGGGFLWGGGVCYRLSGNGGVGALPYSSVRLLLETWLQQASRMESGNHFLREVPQGYQTISLVKICSLKGWLALVTERSGVSWLGGGHGQSRDP